ncbi:MAG: cytochrome c biogenesis protein ResB [Planctomycetota bacterium]
MNGAANEKPKQSDAGTTPPAGKWSPSFLSAAVFALALVLLFIVGQHCSERFDSMIPVIVVAALLAFAGIVLVAIKPAAIVSLFTSVKLAVVLLVLFALACVASTFVLQQPGRLPVEEKDRQARYDNYLNAQARFVYKICHPSRHHVAPLEPMHDKYLGRLEKKFGPDYAREKRKEFIKSTEQDAEQQAVQEFVNNNQGLFEFIYSVCVFTRLDRAYSAWWFRALAVLLLVNTLSCTASRYRLRFSQTGFLLTHTGLVLAIVGAGIDGMWEQKGMLPFIVGMESQNRYTSFVDQHARTAVPFGFAVEAKYFKTEYRKTLTISFADVGTAGASRPIVLSRSYNRLRKGERLVLDEGRLTITVEDILPHAVFKDDLLSKSDEPKNPAVELLMKLGDSPKFVKLFARGDRSQRYLSIPHRMHIKFAWLDSPSDLQAEVARFSAESPCLLIAVTADQRVTLRPIQKGDKFQHGDYAIEVLDCQGNVDVKSHKPLGEQEAQNPGALLKVTLPDGKTEEKQLLAKAPHHYQVGELFMSLAWEARDTTRYLLYGAGKGPVNVMKIAGKKAVGPRPMERGQSLDTSEPGSNVFLSAIALDADVVGVAPYDGNDGAAADDVERYFTDPSEGAVKLHIKRQDFEETAMLLANDTRADEYERPGYVSLKYEDDVVLDYKTYLVIESEDDPPKTLAEKVIEVNHPLSYGGFTFYQEDARKEMPRYTGIKVRRAPGAWLAQFGSVLMLIGILFAFYVKPALRKGT